jgi:hypothetical protein
VAAAENSRLKGLRSGEAFASGLPFSTAQNIQMQTLSTKTVEVLYLNYKECFG